MLDVTMKHQTRRHERRCSPILMPVATFILLIPGAGMVPAIAQAMGEAAPQGASAATPITLDEAIRRAEASEPSYAAVSATARVSSLDRSIARAGLLPSVTYTNQALYTQPNGLYAPIEQGGSPQALPKFIANNGEREYISQGLINETLGLGQVAVVRRADAASALAAAELEISRRGLVAAVTSLYYGLAAADDKLAVAERARAEAADFTKLTREREQAREAAHGDVVKAELQEQQQERNLSDAKLLAEKARLELAILLFPDPHTAYEVVVPQVAPPLAARADVELAAGKNNPELKSALATVSVSNANVLAARAGYLPTVGMNVTYGIDAPQVAVNGPDGARNLGYSASLTVDIPVWDWLATEHKVKQSEIEREAAHVALTATQRRLIARLDEAYAEAQGARDQLVSLDTSVATAAESLRLTKLRYASGEALVLEVVDAQTANLAAENAREDGRVRYEMALADLQTLTGTM